MAFFKENIKAIILVLLVILSEVIYSPFSDIVHHYTNGNPISWGDVIYYSVAQFGYINFIPALFLYLSEKNIHSRGILLGLVIYNITELLQELNILLKLNIEVLNRITNLCVSDTMQVIFIIFVVVSTYYAHRKWST